jgi:3-oxo-5-alpha-steroid 4-dehydrogenase 1
MQFFFDMPFGKFTPSKEGWWTIDGIIHAFPSAPTLTSNAGIKSWIFMEAVAPVTVIYAYLQSPLSPTHFGSSPPLTLSHPPTLLAGLFVIHYINRAFISPLRTPSRAKSTLMVLASGTSFHLIHGLLLGAYLSSPAAEAYLDGAYGRARFWIGLALWMFGFVGNIIHDEILLNIRRNRAMITPGNVDTTKQIGKERYAIPYGGLYRFVSFPNYLCEWIEWLGYALAACPLPSLASGSGFVSTVAPPWLFFLCGAIAAMLPRAVRGHQWYHEKFQDYPKERKAVIPFLL